MNNRAKLLVVCVFCAVAVGITCSRSASNVSAVVQPQNAPAAPAADDKKIPATFTLASDSVSDKYGEVPFNHENHAFKKYSADGNSVMACVECHHTDQPKSALTGPLKTSERDVTLTNEVFQKTTQKVTHCRDCHFQDGSVPDGKTMPTATYAEAGGSKTKNLDNQLAFHINCNTCHDAAFEKRPDLKKKPGFATSKDCVVCHKPV